jgi:hypothetical protein
LGHSYRDEDAAINRHFGILSEQAELVGGLTDLENRRAVV